MLKENELLELFDTKLTTKNIHVSLNIKFYARLDHVNKEGNSLLYLYITSRSRKELISLSIYVPSSLWNKDKQRVDTKNLSVSSPELQKLTDINLQIDNVAKRVYEIKLDYRLNDRVLTIEKFIEEYKSGFSRVDFLQFAERICDREEGIVSPRTNQKRRSVVEKIRLFKNEVEFGEIDLDFIAGYKKFWLKDKVIKGKKVAGNNLTTIGSDLKCIKKWLKLAKNYGIRLSVNIDDIKVDRTTSTREYLNKLELKKIHDYYFSQWIKEKDKITIGLFLFACFTSLRISDIKRIKREDLENPDYKFTITKTKKSHSIKFNQTAIDIAQHNPYLFVEWKSEQRINDDLKEIMYFLGIKKRITFHCARHTFATNYLRLGGKVEVLQVILGHSRIDETMIYVHIIEQEREESIMIMDDIFK